MKLSVLDQSPISKGQSATDAFRNTTRLAQETEKMGYTRFWVAEHHATSNFAGSSPEVLIPHLAANTEKMRIGSGGVMMTHYSAYKVAENFKVMESLYPDRIDLGSGRAPGGMPIATLALNNGGQRMKHQYSGQIDELLYYLYNRIPENHPYYGLKTIPFVNTAPPVWLLGSSIGSAKLAAQKGVSFCFAHFINAEEGEKAAEHYQNCFKPSPEVKEPKMIVTVFALTAETEDKAEELANVLDHLLLSADKGERLMAVPDFESVQRINYEPYERKQIQRNRDRMVIGTPASVKRQLECLSDQYQTDEIMIVSITHSIEDKIHSYQLIAQQFLE